MKYAFLILVLSTTLLSCSKDDEQFKRDALTTGTWKLTVSETDYNKDGVYEEDTYAILDSCIKDNIYTFQADGSEIIDDGSTKCDYPQIMTSSWSFNDNQTWIEFGGVNYQIEELNAATFRVKARVSYNIIFTIDVKYTFTKQ